MPEKMDAIEGDVHADVEYAFLYTTPRVANSSMNGVVFREYP
jgi:hypothetical protein